MLAVASDRLDIALDAVSQLPDRAARIVHAVLLRYQKGDHAKAVRLIDELIQIPLETPLVTEALMMGAQCARYTFNQAGEEACKARLRETPRAEEWLCVLDYVTAATGGSIPRESALSQLRAGYERWPASAALQDHLIVALRASKRGEAEIVMRIAEQITARRQLVKREVIQVAQSLQTIDRNSDALRAVEDASTRFPDDLDIRAFRALLYEQTGEAHKARQLLESILDSPGQIPEVARSIYINIAARCGRLKEAVRQFETLLCRASGNDAKADILRSIFALEQHANAGAARLTWLAFSYGALIDQHDEFPEAMFLQMVLTAGLGATEPLSGTERQSFETRSQRFVEHFPQSKYFSAIELPKDVGPQDLIKLMHAKLGQTEADVEQMALLKKRLSRGTLPVPYAWRPRRVLQMVASVPHLWEYTKRTGQSSPAYTLLMHRSCRTGRDLHRHGLTPLVDRPTLLVLTELGLWPALLSLFPTIAITKWTLMRIQFEASPMGFPTDTVLALRAAISSHIDHILQPGVLDEDWMKVRDAGFSDFKSVLASGSYWLYCDDFVTRAFVLGEAHEHEQSFTTIDLIESAEKAGVLSPREAAQRIARLVSWNIGNVPISYRHFVASIPVSVNQTRGVAKKTDILFCDPSFRALVDAAWSYDKRYLELIGHLASVLAQIVNDNPEADADLLAAIWIIWFDKVAMRPDIRVTPEQHIAFAFVKICSLLVERAQVAVGVRRMWNAYRDVLHHRHKERMDESKEREGIRCVGQVLAQVTCGRNDLGNSAADILRTLKSGLTPETADEMHFLNGYRDECAAWAERERKKGRLKT